MRCRSLFYLLSLLIVGLAACGGCGDEEKQAAVCGPMEVPNPISGQCEPSFRTDNSGDSGMDVALDEAPDQFFSPFLDMMAEIPDGQECSPDLDSDQDQLTNACECELATDPAWADTDRDGVHDGGEDRNGNCRYDVGQETDPRRADTDNDGLDDGDERDANTDPLDVDSDDDNVLDGPEVESGCMDPLNPDSDGDSIPDDIEDANGDGMLGTCPNRMYDPECGGIESDPCAKDTDGDGTDDNEEAQFLGCRPEDTANLVDPQFVEDNAGNYKLALDVGLTSDSVIGLNAHAFDDQANGYAGFVHSMAPPAGATSAELLAAHVFGRIASAYPGSVQRSTGRRIQTHDGFAAVVSAVAEVGAGLRPDAVRDGVLASLEGIGMVSHNAGGTFAASGPADPILVVYEVVERDVGNPVVVAAAVPESAYNNAMSATGFRVDDVTGGTALAQAGEALESECVSYRNDKVAKVDFVWILDASGSMDDEINQVRQFARDFTTILQNSNVDWRIGVTNATCSDIHADSAITPEVKSLYDPPGLTGPCGAPPIGSPPPIRNGILCNNAFTSDPAVFEACISTVRSGLFQTEHTMSIGAAVVDRALGRSDNDPSKFRTDAAIVLISITDEFDEMVGSAMGWGDAGGAGDPAFDPSLNAGYDQAQVDGVVAPFVDYFLRGDVGATLFGIYWVPGTSCPSAWEASAGIHSVVTATGGTAGSVCQSDLTATLQQIAEASVGIASGLRLRGVPVAPSIVTTVGEVQSGMIVDWPRSRADGWDYDSIVNRVTFQGPSPPQTGDRVVIAYRRWEGSIRQCDDDADCPREQKYRCVSGLCL